MTGERPYTICSAPGAASAIDNWLIWAPVRVPKNVTRLDLDITAAVQDCSSIPGGPYQYCKHFFDVYQYDFDYDKNPSPKPPQNSDFVKKVKTITVRALQRSTGKPSGSKTRVNLNISTTVQESGVFFAIHDNGICMAVFSIAVSYRICSEKPENFVNFSSTIPPSDSSKRLKVVGTCVDNAVTVGVSELSAFCESNGNWSLSPGVGCECSPGYQPANDKCEGQ